MTSLASNDESGAAASTPESQPPYCVPRQLTLAGRRAFHDEIREWAAQLGEQMEVEAHKAHRTDPEYTVRDVQEARVACEQRIREKARGNGSDRRVLAAMVLTIATVGISAMANFLHSTWQTAVFALFVGAGLVGLMLTWTGRPRKRTPR